MEEYIEQIERVKHAQLAAMYGIPQQMLLSQAQYVAQAKPQSDDRRRDDVLLLEEIAT